LPLLTSCPSSFFASAKSFCRFAFASFMHAVFTLPSIFLQALMLPPAFDQKHPCGTCFYIGNVLAESHFINGRRRRMAGAGDAERDRPQRGGRCEQRTAGAGSYDGISTKKTADKPINIAASINITMSGILIANLLNYTGWLNGFTRALSA
jgi:hypothetical protein